MKTAIRRTRRRRRRGVFDRWDPHSSYSQLALRFRCKRNYKDQYIDGHTVKGDHLEWGTILHNAVRRINAMARDSKDGIGPEDLERVLSSRSLTTFKHFNWYKGGCDGLEKYAELVNQERGTIVALEMPVEIQVPVQVRRRGKMVTKVIKFRSFIDRVDRLRDGRYRFWEYKSYGALRSREEVLQDFQNNTYNAQIRRHFGYHGKIICVYYSILLGKWFEVEFDVKDAIQTERYIADGIKGQLTDKTFEPTFNDRCGDCRLMQTCPEFKKQMSWMDGTVLTASPQMLSEMKAASKIYNERAAKIQMLLATRIDREGPEIIENGWRAFFSHQKGHKVAAFETAPSSTMRIQRVSR